MGGNGEQVEVDRIWTSLGPWGRYQIKQYISYCLICISWVIHQLTIVFIGYRPNFHCKAGLNDSLIANKTGAIFEYGECKVERYENTSTGMVKTTSECQHGWTYDIPTDQSFVSEWDFVCEKEELAEMTQLLLFVGMIIGTCFFPQYRFGRKPVMVFSHICLFAIVLATSFSPNYTTFVVLRILTGAVTQGALSGTTLASETFPKECRHLTEVFALVVWTSSICIMSPIAYALRNVSWRYLQITFALMSAWSLLQWWFLDESLRWLIANGKMDQARKIIRKACRYNRKDYHTVLKDSGLDEGGDEHVRLSKDGGALQLDAIAAPTPIPDVFVEKYTICDMFKNKMIRNVSFIIWYTWIVDSLVYYGLYMISSDLYGDRYINFFLSALIEYPASVFEYFALVKIGRKWTCVICHSVAAIALIVATAFRYSAGADITSGIAVFGAKAKEDLGIMEKYGWSYWMAVGANVGAAVTALTYGCMGWSGD
ncbi:organic cation transporter-like protein [Mya arenaria]|uniref:organic cation transporter-like protein n=1 Tax=Mya arenaria TaxID=6604 RepID=UPI0022E77B16|nr:organic cation transporter-like protein [Mya arenaria]